MPDPTQIGRIALRQDGEVWIAYYARPETMEGAVEMCRINLAVVLEDDAIKKAFMQLARDIMSHYIGQTLGTTPQWRAPTAAPDHERKK